MTSVSRRTVAKGAAWAVPVVAVGAAAPAYAASAFITIDGDGCKLPGYATETYKGYAFHMTVTNPSPDPVTVTITSMTLNGGPLGTATIVNLTGCSILGVDSFIVPGNTSLSDLALLTSHAANSSNGQLIVNYTTTDPNNASGTISTAANAANPMTSGGGSCDNFTRTEQDCIVGLTTV